MIGKYAGIESAKNVSKLLRYTSPPDAFKSYGKVRYEVGCDVACLHESLIYIFPAMAAAKEAHATIVMAGLDLPVEAEGLDRADLLLPGGRLPLTWYEAGYIEMLPMTSMPLRLIDTLGYPGRTYKLLNGSTVYPFGYGLSYTQFNYTLIAAVELMNILLNKTQHCHKFKYRDETYKPSCPAVLLDDLDRSEVVFVYSKPPDGIVGTHAKQVIGFERVFAKAGQRMEVNFVIGVPKSLGIVDYTGYKLFTIGDTRDRGWRRSWDLIPPSN
ncbi:hypothetical protein ACFX19_037094 [Malus domestica]